MQKVDYTFQDKTVSFLFDADFSAIESFLPEVSVIFITDDHIHQLHSQKFAVSLISV